MRRTLVIAACLAALAAPFTDAKTLRWSSQGDYLTADPMAQNELLTNSINGHVYESLIVRGKKLELIPGLAVGWKQTAPTFWCSTCAGREVARRQRLHCRRRGLLHQARPGPTSNFRVYANAVGEPKKIDVTRWSSPLPVPNRPCSR